MSYVNEFFRVSKSLLSVVSREGYFLELNDAWEEALGWKLEELKSKPFYHFVHEEDREPTKLATQALDRNEPVSGFRNRYRHKNGHYIWLDWDGNLSKDGKVWLAAATDVTLDRQRTDLLIEMQKAAKIGGWRVNTEDSSLELTEQTYHIYDLPLGQVPDLKTGISFFTPPSQEKIRAALNLAITKGESFDLEVEFISSKNNRLWIRGIGIPVFENGRVISVFGTVQDITKERKNIDVVLEKTEQARDATERFQAIVEHIPTMISIFDSEGRFVWVNKEWSSQLGWTLDEIQGQTGAELFKFDANFGEHVVEHMTKANSAWQEFYCPKKDGSRIETTWANVRLSNGMGVGIGLNVDEEKKLHRSLRLSNEEILKQKSHIDALIANAPGIVYQFLLEKNGSVSFPFVAPTALAYFEISKEELAKDSLIIMSLVAPDERDRLNQLILDSAESLKQFEWIGRFVLRSGEMKYLKVRSIPKRLPNGDTLWDGIMIDFTREMALEGALELERAKAHQASKMATLGEMAAGVAHEINNPLSVVAATASLILTDGAASQRLPQRVEQISRSVSRISKIINGLRKFSRSAAKNEKRSHRISAICEETLLLTQSNAKRRDVRLELEIQQDAQVFCNDIEIEQILINLVNNAIDAVEECSDRWIKIRVGELEGKVQVLVSDSGSGIASEIRERIFEPFFTTKIVGQGTGLGLSISKGIAEDHGGQIQLLHGDGPTTMELILPIHKD